MTAYVGWSSGSVARPSQQPVAATHFVHEETPVPGCLNVYRLHTLRLDEEWTFDGDKWDGVALDELQIHPGESGELWRERVLEVKGRCAHQGWVGTPLALTWQPAGGSSDDVYRVLTALRDVVDVWCPQLFLAAPKVEPGLAVGELLVSLSAEAGVWSRSVPLFNVSDMPGSWTPDDTHYAVFKHDGDDRYGDQGWFPVTHGYRQLAETCRAVGECRGFGYWSCGLLSERSLRVLALLEREFGL